MRTYGSLDGDVSVPIDKDVVSIATDANALRRITIWASVLGVLAWVLMGFSLSNLWVKDYSHWFAPSWPFIVFPLLLAVIAIAIACCDVAASRARIATLSSVAAIAGTSSLGAVVYCLVLYFTRSNRVQSVFLGLIPALMAGELLLILFASWVLYHHVKGDRNVQANRNATQLVVLVLLLSIVSPLGLFAFGSFQLVLLYNANYLRSFAIALDTIVIPIVQLLLWLGAACLLALPRSRIMQVVWVIVSTLHAILSTACIMGYVYLFFLVRSQIPADVYSGLIMFLVILLFAIFVFIPLVQAATVALTLTTFKMVVQLWRGDTIARSRMLDLPLLGIN